MRGDTQRDRGIGNMMLSCVVDIGYHGSWFGRLGVGLYDWVGSQE